MRYILRIDGYQYSDRVVVMSRVQLALNVADLEASVAFYSTVFGVEPHKRRPGYANFVVADPALKLVLIEVPADARGTGPAGALNHLGVEVDSAEEVHAATQSLVDAGLATFEEADTTCCYALQDKVWISDPAGTPWEVYTVKDDDPANPQPATSSLPLLEATGGGCCTPASSAESLTDPGPLAATVTADR
jgi:catechol 2,3-dioxygenase-like lactoylglutathione lyase family enzyme